MSTFSSAGMNGQFRTNFHDTTKEFVHPAGTRGLMSYACAYYTDVLS